MTYIGLTRDDLTPDEQIDPMDCADVEAMVGDWVYQLVAGRSDATLPNGEVVLRRDDFLEDVLVMCQSRAHLAVAYFKSLNDKEFDQ